MTSIIESIKKDFSSLKKSKEESLKEHFIDQYDKIFSQGEKKSKLREEIENLNIYLSFLNKSREESLKKYYVDYYNLITSPKTKKELEEKRYADKTEYQKQLFDQIILFRKCTFTFMIAIMSVETFLLFFIVIFSSITVCPNSKILEINPTTLQVLTASTIIQISTMVIVMVQSVFPRNLDDLIFKDVKTST